MSLSSKRATAAMCLAALACLLLTSVFSAPLSAATAKDVSTANEAWYEAPVTGGNDEDPTCTLPVGCAPAAVPVVAGEKTLQVGASAGRDRARTFLALDFSALPEGALLTGGTLTLPVLQSEDSGSLRPETAQLSACSALGTIKDAQGGSADDQPEFSCDTSSELKYDAKAKPPVFTADLKPLAALLTAGGIAIVPSKQARDGGGTFQVAFPTKEHAAEEQITATLTYDEAPSFGTVSPPPAPGPAEPAAAPPIKSFDSGSSSGGGEASAPPPSISNPIPQDIAAPSPATAGGLEAEQPVAAGPTPAPAAAATPLAMVPAGYAYPAVWLAPLVLIGVAIVLGRSLTGEIVFADGADTGKDPDLITRVIAAFRAVPPPT